MFIRNALPENSEEGDVNTQRDHAYLKFPFDANEIKAFFEKPKIEHNIEDKNFTFLNKDVFLQSGTNNSGLSFKIKATDSLNLYIQDHIWMKIFSYVDIKTITILMASCKKIATLANDKDIGRRLLSYYRLFRLVQPTPIEFRYDKFLDPSELILQLSKQQHEPDRQSLQNDNEIHPGQMALQLR